jgi:LPXTG-site transpeptidase (sortase) family protein
VPSSAQSAGTPATPARPTINPNQFVANTVTVPRIGARAPIVEIANNTEKVQQEGLTRGVIHIYGTPSAGQPGNAFFAGHSSDWFGKPGNYKNVFALLPEVRDGDYFIISNETAMYYYRVVETVITGPKDTTVLERGEGAPFASLQTSYPVGAAHKRFVVVGKLERTVEVDK